MKRGISITPAGWWGVAFSHVRRTPAALFDIDP
jgi:hypothetical protein